MLGLADAIKKYDGLIFTDTQVIDVKKQDEQYISFTENHTVKSKNVVIATHYPFINFPGFYFAKMYQSTSYAIAIESPQQFFDGMYINTR